MDSKTKARKVALLQIAERAKVDLYFLCKYILDYGDILDPKVHGPLCRLTRPLLFKGDISILDKHNFPSDWGNEEEDGMPTFEEKKAFMEWQQSFEPSLDAAHAVRDKLNDGIINLLTLMPRGSLKSSVITIGFTIQWLLNFPDDRVLLDSETATKSWAFLAEIKGHYENGQKLRDLYWALYDVLPDQNKKSDKWSDSAINLAARSRKRKEESISTAGIDATKTGMHYDLIIMDDLHSEKNITTPDQIEGVKTHYKLVYSLLDPGKPSIVIGTRWDFADLYQHIIDEESEDFNFITRSAESASGELFYPKRLDRKFLDRQKMKQGSYIYSCQYLNLPVDSATATFKREYFQYKLRAEVDQIPMNLYMFVDPSFEGPYSDYVGGIIAGMDDGGQLYLIEAIRKKMNYSQIVNLIFDYWKKYNGQLRRIGLETIATQKNIQYILNQEYKRRSMWLPVQEFKQRTKSKEERIRALAPYYEFKRVYHVKECPQLAEVEYELLHFPKAKHDDLVDAFSGILEIATPARGKVLATKEEDEKREDYLEMLNKPRSPRVGY